MLCYVIYYIIAEYSWFVFSFPVNTATVTIIQAGIADLQTKQRPVCARHHRQGRPRKAYAFIRTLPQSWETIKPKRQ